MKKLDRGHAVVLSPSHIRQYSTDLMYPRWDEEKKGDMSIFVLANFPDAFRSGKMTLQNIEMGMRMGRKEAPLLTACSLVVIFLCPSHLDIIEPLMGAVPQGKLWWVICKHAEVPAKKRLKEAGLSSAYDGQILVIGDCSGENELGYLIWHLQSRGEVSLTRPYEKSKPNDKPYEPVAHPH
ncbi:MAG: hypothetical protein AAB660_02305 [Patescibacteria group bacterium]